MIAIWHMLKHYGDLGIINVNESDHACHDAHTDDIRMVL